MSNKKEKVMRELKAIKLVLLGVMILFLFSPSLAFAAAAFDGDPQYVPRRRLCAGRSRKAARRAACRARVMDS